MQTVRSKGVPTQQLGGQAPGAGGGSGNPHKDVWKHLDLDKYPPSDVPSTDVVANLDGDIHTHWALKWRDKETGDWTFAHSKGYAELREDPAYQSVRVVARHITDVEQGAAKDAVSTDEKKRTTALMAWLAMQEFFPPGALTGFVAGDLAISPRDRLATFTGDAFQRTLTCGPVLLKELQRMKAHKKPGDALFSYTSEMGATKPVTFEDLKGYMEDNAEGANLHDFRVFHAARIADDTARRFLETKPPVSDSHEDWANRIFDEITKGVMTQLGGDVPVPAWVEDRLVDYAESRLTLSYGSDMDESDPGVSDALIAAMAGESHEPRELGAPLNERHVDFLKRFFGTKGYEDVTE